MNRVAFLFDEAEIRSWRTCYTTEVLRYLDKNKSRGVGTSVAIVSIGRGCVQQQDTQDAVAQALRSAREVVAGI